MPNVERCSGRLARAVGALLVAAAPFTIGCVPPSRAAAADAIAIRTSPSSTRSRRCPARPRLWSFEARESKLRLCRLSRYLCRF